MSAETVQALYDIANKLRITSIESTNASNSGHPSSCSSMAEIISVLFFHTMRYSVKDPRGAANDRFVLSKGHAAPILYAAWAEAGLFPVKDCLNLRKLDSDLDGHPTPNLPFIDVATGSLGQGLSCAAGMAYTGKNFDKADYRVYCLCGDGESAEGSIWEANAFSSFYKLDNLVNIIDVNRLGQSEPTMYEHHVEVYKARLEAFGWHAIVVDGHSVEQLISALDEAKNTKGKPTCIVAKTFKGKNFPHIEDQLNWHGKPLGKNSVECIEAIRKLIKNDPNKLGCELVKINEPTFKLDNQNFDTNVKLANLPNYKIGDQVATRLAYGNALVNLGVNNKRVVALDAEVKNSTYSINFKNAYPDRFVECFIAEQNLVGVAVGCATRNRTIPFVSTFAAFFSRAYDQIRMGAISQTTVTFSGSHVGCSIGEDGPSQMALEDIAMFRAIPNAVVFYPSDAVSTERAVELAANQKSVSYIRTSRPNTSVIYKQDEVFEVGKAKVVQKSAQDYCTVIGAGITLHEALIAAKNLSGKPIRIIDLFTIKPLDWQTIAENVKQTGNRLVIVEDHYEEGGIGEAVIHSLNKNDTTTKYIFKHLFVAKIPKSGSPTELMALFKIDAKAIQEAVNSF